MGTIEVSAKRFHDALSQAVVERKTTIPVLTFALIRPDDMFIQVIGTDLDKTTFTSVPAIITGTVEPFLVPCRKALDLLKGEDGNLTISVKPNEDVDAPFLVRLEVSGCDYELNSSNPANFPQCPEIPAPQFTLGGDAFKTLLTRTLFAISNEESRYTLQGALFEVTRESLKVVATDGYRLALDRVEVPDAPNGRAIIPRPVLEWLKPRLNKTNVHVTLGAELSCFIVDHLRTTILFRSLKGQFPNYEAIMPRPDSAKTIVAVADTAALYKSLVKVAKCADERSGCVKVSANGKFQLSASSVETGTASAVVPASIEGDEVSIGFCAPYMLDFLKAAGNNPVTIRLRPQEAGLFASPELPGYAYVLMPMRL